MEVLTGRVAGGVGIRVGDFPARLYIPERLTPSFLNDVSSFLTRISNSRLSTPTLRLPYSYDEVNTARLSFISRKHLPKDSASLSSPLLFYFASTSSSPVRFEGTAPPIAQESSPLPVDHLSALRRRRARRIDWETRGLSEDEDGTICVVAQSTVVEPNVKRRRLNVPASSKCPISSSSLGGAP